MTNNGLVRASKLTGQKNVFCLCTYRALRRSIQDRADDMGLFGDRLTIPRHAPLGSDRDEEEIL